MIPAMSLRNFIFRVLISMPFCFCIWYFTANIWTWPIAECTKLILLVLFPKLISNIEHVNYHLNVLTNLGDIVQYKEHHKMAALNFTVNPLQYSYSLALYPALLAASKNFKIKPWIFGILVLLFAIIFGICCDILKSIAFDLAPPGMSYPTGFSAWQLNLLGAGYQFGYLVLPSVLPLIFWIKYNHAFYL